LAAIFSGAREGCVVPSSAFHFCQNCRILP
jgi:hypothetical protein